MAHSAVERLYVKGYAINEKRLIQLQQVVKIIKQSGDIKELSAWETREETLVVTSASGGYK